MFSGRKRNREVIASKPADTLGYNTLAKDILLFKAAQLDNRSLARIAQTSKLNHQIYNPVLTTRRLLQFVMRAKCDDFKTAFVSTRTGDRLHNGLPNTGIFQRKGNALYYINLNCHITDKIPVTNEIIRQIDDEFKAPKGLEYLTTEQLQRMVNLTGYFPNAHTYLLSLKLNNPTYWQHLFRKTQGIEYGDRKWHSISPFEYAVWSADPFMLSMLLSHIPDEYKYLAYHQLIDVMENGTEHGKPASYLPPVIDAYNTFCREYNNWSKEKIDNQWVKIIGGLQKSVLPTFVLQLLCDDKGLIDFLKGEEPNRHGQLWNMLPHARFSLFPFQETGGLGEEFAIYHGWTFDVRGGLACWSAGDTQNNLYGGVTEDYIRLIALHKYLINYLNETLSKLAKHGQTPLLEETSKRVKWC